MAKSYEFRIQELYEFEGCGHALTYISKGHHAPEAFLSELQAGFKLGAPVESVWQGYHRVLPGGVWEVTKPGPGAFPVTLVEAHDVRPDEEGAGD